MTRRYRQGGRTRPGNAGTKAKPRAARSPADTTPPRVGQAITRPRPGPAACGRPVDGGTWRRSGPDSCGVNRACSPISRHESTADTPSARPAITAPSLPRHPHDHAGQARTGIAMHPTRQRTPAQANPAATARPWPSVESRRCAPTARAAPTPVRYASVDPATCWSTARQGDTPRDKGKRPVSARIRS
jgi:hypothetical protein